MENNIDFHNTKAFNDMEIYANNNGINAVEDASADSSHGIDNIQARYTLKNVIGESENPDVEVLSTAHELFMHNKKLVMDFLRILIDDKLTS